MEITQIIPHVEALIFASDHPLAEIEIVDLLNNSQGFLEDLAGLEQVQSAIEAIEEKYQSEFYSFELKRSGGGYQFLTKPAFYPTVAQLNGDKYLKKLSTAALETLSIIAYKQPITKGEIESIRGVNSDYSIQKLLEKELIMISGRREDAVGKPLIYTTSKSFMDYFGLNSPEDLPKIREVLQEAAIHPTLVQEQVSETAGEEAGEDGEDGHLEVSETGELLMRDASPEATNDEAAHPESTHGGPEEAPGEESADEEELALPDAENTADTDTTDEISNDENRDDDDDQDDDDDDEEEEDDDHDDDDDEEEENEDEEEDKDNS